MAITRFDIYLEQKKEQDILAEAFNSPSYEITFGKKGAGDIFFTFVDEDNKEFRIQFYTPAGLGKSVRQVFIGQKKGSVYPDAQQRFKNPMKVIATMIEATKQFLQTPIGKGIDGFAINFSKKALERGLALIPRIIKQSDLKQKLNVLDLTFSPDPARGYVWVIRKGKKPEDVFNGPKMEGVTWDANSNAPVDNPQAKSMTNSNGGVSNVVVSMLKNKMDHLRVEVSGSTISIIQNYQTVATLNDPESSGIIKSLGDNINVFLTSDAKHKGTYATKVEVRKTSSRSGYSYEIIPYDTEGKQIFNLEISKNTTDLASLTAKNPSRQHQYWSFSVTGNDNEIPLLNYDDGVSSYRVIGIPKTGSISAYRDRTIKMGDAKTIEGALKKISGSNPPEDLKQKFMAMMKMPETGIPLKDLTIPKGGDLGTDARNPSSGKVFWNGFKFPKTPDGAEDITFATKIEMSKDSAKITENVYRGGGIINSPRTFELGRSGLNNVAVVNRYLEERAKKIDHYKWVISTLADTNYNPSGLAMTDVEFTHDGRMLLGGNNVSSMTGSQVISYIDGMKRSEAAKTTMAQQAALSNLKKEIGSYNADMVMGVAKILGITAASADKAMDAMIQKSNLQDIRVAKKKYDATTAAIKFKNAGNTSIEELKTSVILMAKGGGSDVDWQVYTRGDSVIAEWNITYRRDTCVGAFHNYRASVNSANKVLQAIKTKYEVLGFNVDLRLMTEEQAQKWDNIAEMNEGSAYSEYEASIGGSVTITK